MIIQRPGTVVEVTLPFQSKLPEADRIKFKAKALTCAEQMDYQDALNRACTLPTREQVKGRAAREAQPAVDGNPAIQEVAAVPGIGDVIRRVAIDWSNAVDADGKPLPFTDESFMLCTLQMLELIAAQLPDAAGWGDLRQGK